jgi:protein-S-isoprenylcysteine O-methyltransferase Ste14
VPSTKLLLRLIVQSGLWIALMGVLLFWPAGNWRWPQAWAFLAIFTMGTVLFCAWLWRRDPALLASRLSLPVQKGQASWDKMFMGAMLIGWNVWLVLMALDAQRWHLSHMPVWLEVIGGFLIVGGFVIVVPVFAANTFAAPVVRVQDERGQHVIDTGPYAIVRHPMYAGASLYVFGVPLLLGSWYGLIGAVAIMLGISWRSVREENALRRDLTGYADYMTRVRWRLVPHVW